MRIGEHLQILTSAYATVEARVSKCADALQVLVACQAELLDALVALKRRSDGVTFKAADALF